MKKITVGGLPGNVLGMLADLMSKLKNGTITPRQLERFCKKQNPFNLANHSEVITEWQFFYKKFFSNEYDFSNIFIPEKPNIGCWRLLIIADLTLEQLYAKCSESFGINAEDVDKKVVWVVWNERDAKNGVYAIWIKDNVEADEDLRNISANDIKVKNITTETLAERLIHELKFFDETGKHLDTENSTLCSGSRYEGNSVPVVEWHHEREPRGGCPSLFDDDGSVGWDDFEWLRVKRVDSNSAHDKLRSRQVVS